MSDFSFFSASIILVLVFPVFHGLGGGPSLACCGPLSFTRTTSTASFLECFFLLNVEEGRGVLPPDEAIEGGRVVAPDEAVPVVKSMGEKTNDGGASERGH